MVITADWILQRFGKLYLRRMLQKGFLRKKENIHISRSRFLRAVLYGIATTLGVYTLLCGLREGFRTLDFLMSNGPTIFDDVTRNWQNVNFALISSVFGNSIFIGTIFMSPVKGSILKYKRLAILNDQIFLGGNFLYLFFKLFALFGIFAAISFDFNYLKEHMYIFVLLAIVLFLESWKHIIRVYKRKAYKLMIINLLAIVFVVFTVSKISIFNYKKIDAALLEKNPKIDLPISSFRNNKNTWKRDFLKIYSENDVIKYNLNRESISFDEIFDRIVASQSRYHDWGNERRPVFIFASHNLPISEVKKVEKELAYALIRKLIYVTRKPYGQFTSRFESDGIHYSLNWANLSEKDFKERALSPPPILSSINQNFFKDKRFIDVDIRDTFRIEGKEYTNKKELVLFFKEHINDTTCFNLKYLPTTSFQNYISALGIYKQALIELRDEITTLNWQDVEYNWSLREQYETEQYKARNVYPYTMLENFNYNKN